MVSKEVQLDLAELTVTVDIQVEGTCRELGRRQVRDIDEGALNIYMASVALGEDTIIQEGVGSGKSRAEHPANTERGAQRAMGRASDRAAKCTAQFQEGRSRRQCPKQLRSQGTLRTEKWPSNLANVRVPLSVSKTETSEW